VSTHVLRYRKKLDPRAVLALVDAAAEAALPAAKVRRAKGERAGARAVPSRKGRAEGIKK
jgi:hypothetical protein